LATGDNGCQRRFSDTSAAFVINLVLMSIYTMRRSVMARRQLQEWWAGVTGWLLLAQWRPIRLRRPFGAPQQIVVAISRSGVSFAISHRNVRDRSV
jgi:protein-S-isoprenylcysteine O-methyltransferase Ste14